MTIEESHGYLLNGHLLMIFICHLSDFYISLLTAVFMVTSTDFYIFSLGDP